MIVVLGDAMLDEYVIGTADRLSPECPGPVVKISSRQYRPGGAAAVAAMCRSLTSNTALMCACGADNEGTILREILTAGEISLAMVREVPRPTTLKTRVVANGVMLHLRLDREDCEPVCNDTVAALSTAFIKVHTKISALVIQDYGKGLCREDLVKNLADRAHELDKPVIVDPCRDRSWAVYGPSVTAFKANLSEAVAELVRLGAYSGDGPDVVAERLRNFCDATVIVTCGADGIHTALRGCEKSFFVPALRVDVRDACGAGDTVLAAVATAMGYGETIGPRMIQFAAELAAEQVRHLGVLTDLTQKCQNV